MVLQKDQLGEETRVRNQLGSLLLDKGNSPDLILEGVHILMGIQSPTKEVIHLQVMGLLKGAKAKLLEIEVIDLEAPMTEEQEILLMHLRDLATETLFILKSAARLAKADLQLKDEIGEQKDRAKKLFSKIRKILFSFKHRTWVSEGDGGFTSDFFDEGF